MSVSMIDRVRIFLFSAKIRNEMEFKTVWKATFGEKKKLPSTPAQKNYLGLGANGSSTAGSIHESKLDEIVTLIKNSARLTPNNNLELLDPRVPISPSELLTRLELKYADIQDIVSLEFDFDWKNRYSKLYFMENIYELFSKDDFASTFLKKISGTYRLYRRHSFLPEILREYVVVNPSIGDFGIGVYVQYSRSKKPSIIPLNVFYCGFYFMFFSSNNQLFAGLNDDAKARQLEIIFMQVLSGNIKIPNDNSGFEQSVRDFVGILNGISDTSETLVASRIILRKDSENSIPDHEVKTAQNNQYIKSLRPERLVFDELKPEQKIEYKTVSDVISSEIDDNLLSVNAHRMRNLF